MASYGASLQKFNVELVQKLQLISERRDNLVLDIEKENCRKNEVEKIINDLIEEIDILDKRLDNKYKLKKDIENVILKTEKAYNKILESSEILYNILKKDEDLLLNRMKDDIQEN